MIGDEALAVKATPHSYPAGVRKLLSMKILKWVTCVAVMGVLVGCNKSPENSGASSGDQTAGTKSGQGASSAPDNTGRNVRDRSDTALTPGDQRANNADVDITRRIRRALIGNDQLSAEAKNIKVITSNGKVTLRGPVKNHQELDAIQSIAQQAGASSIDNQLEVEATNQ